MTATAGAVAAGSTAYSSIVSSEMQLREYCDEVFKANESGTLTVTQQQDLQWCTSAKRELMNQKMVDYGFVAIIVILFLITLFGKRCETR